MAGATSACTKTYVKARRSLAQRNFFVLNLNFNPDYALETQCANA
jgi:hypothetical protein